MIIDYLESPVGLIEIKADDKGITHISLVKTRELDSNGNELTEKAKIQLDKYFLGQVKEFDLPLNFEDGTSFYKRVWAELLNIPYGSTASYLDVAKRLGDPKSTRAVGMANGKNPIAIVIPCHRVIGNDGSLTGYAHGVDIKRKLLAIENPNEYAVNGTLF